MPKFTGVLILAGLLFALVPSASADTILQYSASGTFSGATPTSTFSAPGATWAFSFQVDTSNLVVSDVATSGPAQGFDVAFSNFSYFLNGSLVSFTPGTPGFIRFRNTADAFPGGFGICFDSAPPCLNELAEGGPQMYTGSESAPTLLLGAFPSAPGLFQVAVNDTVYVQPDNSLKAALVPEPSSLLLLGTGLLGLMAMAWRGGLRKQASA